MTAATQETPKNHSQSTPIDLGPGLDENGLALMVSGLLEEGLGRDAGKRSLLTKMTGVVVLKATDADVAVTLRFADGRVALANGSTEAADVEVAADTEQIAGLTLLRFWGLLPNPVDGAGRSFLSAFATGKLRLQGALFHPRLLLQFARLMSVQS